MSELEDKTINILNALKQLESFGEKNITCFKKISAKEGSFVDFPEYLNPELINALKKKGIKKLYSHQASALDHLKKGKNIVVVTPTASGKTLCYNLPVLNSILEEKSSCALYLFPTKALSQDQRAELDEIIGFLNKDIKVFTYDGDTPVDARRAIRHQAHIILTNPDMLHSGILPHHTKWIRIFENLKYVVIDELHNYRGVFGSHFANVIRRLKRICNFYNSNPQFILCSATIANPKEMAEKMIGEEVELINESGAPSGEKYFIFYNPPVVNPYLGIRRSYIAEARRIASTFIKNNLQTIVFAQSRLITEVLLSYLKEEIENHFERKDLVRGYRGGYLPSKRREIEKDLREGRILAVITTNALELGIDIGSLDACVLAAYPGTIASTWQRAGRAGRRYGKSVVVLVASSAPIDQFIVNSPEYFFSKTPEMGLINPDNLSILINHIECAIFELPFQDGEKFGDIEVREILEFLKDENLIHHSKNKWFWCSDSYPANGVSLRSLSSDNFVVIDITEQPKTIAEVDFSSAFTTLYPKAIYLCEGEQYFVEKLDYPHRKAYVKKTQVDYFTQAVEYSRLKILDIFETKNLEKFSISHGEVHVVNQVVGFKKIKFHTMENIGYGEVNLPSNEMHTTSYWITIPNKILNELSYTVEEKIHGLLGLSYLFHSIAPLFLMADWNDIKVSIGDNYTGESIPVFLSLRFKNFYDKIPSIDFEPNIFIYDNYPGGMGFSEALFKLEDKLIDQAKKIIENCPCKEGCPSCVGPAKESGEKAKEVALE
ncbi:DEAD/DEAH box helicase, partial [Candidatus Aminicenantes bacterium AC-708-I09]|nr:DEAD/DEAH box helicase [Candidatus Aminicenantes bacterium AC-708-I09]